MYIYKYVYIYYIHTYVINTFLTYLKRKLDQIMKIKRKKNYLLVPRPLLAEWDLHDYHVTANVRIM